jgi:hypothetical protein
MERPSSKSKSFNFFPDNPASIRMFDLPVCKRAVFPELLDPRILNFVSNKSQP